jgi:hypothetical protein
MSLWSRSDATTKTSSDMTLNRTSADSMVANGDKE